LPVREGARRDRASRPSRAGGCNGHFNVLRGAIKPPIDSAGVKIVGDFVDNYKIGLPSELAILAMFDPRTGARSHLDASGITDMRTAP